ncbi:sensor histidine kinase [Arthrobacter sp. B2a2-09]|uniref:hypothetical protein n=1 Tax=Arthrobacter sp. B2a2-09 TaxID=2952822 RepID=UPI0022CD44E1|nr:hypothetical protein [Arthrobacter sp. B2a2-09]MCZ9882328.1 hypothetical protein [Arthrobacter sp. B2a2-09]
MSGRSPAHWARGIGGNNALSLWSWLLTLPLALTVMNMFTGSNTLPETGSITPAGEGSGTAIVLLVHVVLGLLGILLRPLITTRPSLKGRITTAFGAFAFLGACRPLLAAWSAQALNIADLSEDLWARILINVGTALVFLSAIAILTDSIRGHAVLERRVRAARAAIEAQLGFDEHRLRSIRSDYVTELSKRLDTVLTARMMTPLDRSEASRLLRTISDDVVRPMSHQLFHDHTPWPYVTAPPRPTSRTESALGLAHLIRPAPVALPVLLFASLIAVRLLTEYGVLFLLVQWVVGGAVLLVGNAAAARTVRRITSPLRRISAMTLCYAGAAVVSASVTCLLQGMFGYAPFFYWSAIWAYPLTALTVAVLQAAERQRRRHEVRLAGSLNELLKLADRTHQKLLHTRRRVARILHTNVQGNLVSSALALAASGGNDAEEDLAPQRVRDILTGAMATAQSEILEESPGHAGHAASSIQDLLSTWGRVLKLACDIDPRVWALCDEDPARAEAVIEVLSEGFTNAIRHGERNHIRVSMSAQEPHPTQPATDTGAIHISISSPGRLRGQIRPSLGMTTLQTLSKEVTLSEDGDSVVLRVVLA